MAGAGGAATDGLLEEYGAGSGNDELVWWLVDAVAYSYAFAFADPYPVPYPDPYAEPTAVAEELSRSREFMYGVPAFGALAPLLEECAVGSGNEELA